LLLLQGITLDQDTAEQLRLEMADKRGGSKSGGKPRGPIDSGKGVRIQVRACGNCSSDLAQQQGPLAGALRGA